MNVLILGAGAREHALALAAAKSPRLGRLFVAPGNPGCARSRQRRDRHPRPSGGCRLLPRQRDRPRRGGSRGAACRWRRGRSRGGRDLPVSARAWAAAHHEGIQKGFTKDFCREFGIPTGDYRRFREPEARPLTMCRRGARQLSSRRMDWRRARGVVVATDTRRGRRRASTPCSTARSAPPAPKSSSIAFLDGEEALVLRAQRSRPATLLRQRAGPPARRRRRHEARTPAAWTPLRRRRLLTAPR